MYLVILSSTQRQNHDPNPLPAIDRYRGLYPSLLRSLQNKGQFPKCDTIFVTAQGIVKAEQQIEHMDTPMTLELACTLREENLKVLKRLLAGRKYDEIYVNLGQAYLKSIEGFERLTDGEVTYAKGVLGRKAVHMKQWGIDHSSAKG